MSDAPALAAPERIWLDVEMYSEQPSDAGLKRWSAFSGPHHVVKTDEYIRADLYESELQAIHVFHEGHEAQMEDLRATIVRYGEFEQINGAVANALQATIESQAKRITELEAEILKLYPGYWLDTNHARALYHSVSDNQGGE